MNVRRYTKPGDSSRVPFPSLSSLRLIQMLFEEPETVNV